MLWTRNKNKTHSIFRRIILFTELYHFFFISCEVIFLCNNKFLNMCKQHKRKLMNNNAKCIIGKKRTEVKEKMLVPIYFLFFVLSWPVPVLTFGVVFLWTQIKLYCYSHINNIHKCVVLYINVPTSLTSPHLFARPNHVACFPPGYVVSFLGFFCSLI